MNPLGKRFTLNSTSEVIEEAVEKLTELGFNGFGLEEDSTCLVVWDDYEFTTVSEHEWGHKDDIETLTNLEDFINAVKKEFIPLEYNLTQQKEKEMNKVNALVLPTEQNLSISELTHLIHTGNVKAGWWGLHSEDGTVLDLAEMIRNPKSLLEERFAMALVAEKLCLTHSEISEGMEGLRKNMMDDKLPHRSMLEVELADAVIRTIDLCGALGLDLQGAIFEKLAYNAQREDHKVENRLKENGKKF